MFESSGKTDGNWSNDPRLRQVNVVVCTASCTLVGTAHLMAQQRLLDELNGSVVANLHHLGEEFLPLTEVRILMLGGGSDVAMSLHVRKSSILFVAERGSGKYEKGGAKDARVCASKVKKPLGARMYLPPYAVEGRMHVGVWQELAQVLDGDSVFLPVTDAVVTPPLANGESAFAFLAANKGQIVHIGELSEALQRLRQDAQRVLGIEQRGVPDLAGTSQS